MTPVNVKETLQVMTYRIFPFIFIIFIGAEVRLIYVMTMRKDSVPMIFRIVIMQILISHMGVKIFALTHHIVLELTGDKSLGHSPHSYCTFISVLEHTFWMSSCLISTLHAVIRFDSIRRPLHYKKNWTFTRLLRITFAIWTLVVALGLVATESKPFYNYMMQALNVLFSIITLLLYIITLVYWKCVKVRNYYFRNKYSNFWDEFRRSIPTTIIRTTLACFALSFNDIFGNLLASYLSLHITLHKTLDEFMQSSDNEQQVLVGMYREIVHLSYKIREILFTILLIALFRKVRRLFFGQKIRTQRRGTELSLTTAIRDSLL